MQGSAKSAADGGLLRKGQRVDDAGRFAQRFDHLESGRQQEAGRDGRDVPTLGSEMVEDSER